MNMQHYYFSGQKMIWLIILLSCWNFLNIQAQILATESPVSIPKPNLTYQFGHNQSKTALDEAAAETEEGQDGNEITDPNSQVSFSNMDNPADSEEDERDERKRGFLSFLGKMGSKVGGKFAKKIGRKIGRKFLRRGAKKLTRGFGRRLRKGFSRSFRKLASRGKSKFSSMKRKLAQKFAKLKVLRKKVAALRKKAKARLAKAPKQRAKPARRAARRKVTRPKPKTLKQKQKRPAKKRTRQAKRKAKKQKRDKERRDKRRREKEQKQKEQEQKKEQRRQQREREREAKRRERQKKKEADRVRKQQEARRQQNLAKQQEQQRKQQKQMRRMQEREQNESQIKKLWKKTKEKAKEEVEEEMKNQLKESMNQAIYGEKNRGRIENFQPETGMSHQHYPDYAANSYNQIQKGEPPYPRNNVGYVHPSDPNEHGGNYNPSSYSPFISRLIPPQYHGRNNLPAVSNHGPTENQIHRDEFSSPVNHIGNEQSPYPSGTYYSNSNSPLGSRSMPPAYQDQHNPPEVSNQTPPKNPGSFVGSRQTANFDRGSENYHPNSYSNLESRSMPNEYQGPLNPPAVSNQSPAENQIGRAQEISYPGSSIGTEQLSNPSGNYYPNFHSPLDYKSMPPANQPENLPAVSNQIPTEHAMTNDYQYENFRTGLPDDRIKNGNRGQSYQYMQGPYDDQNLKEDPHGNFMAETPQDQVTVTNRGKSYYDTQSPSAELRSNNDPYGNFASRQTPQQITDENSYPNDYEMERPDEAQTLSNSRTFDNKQSFMNSRDYHRLNDDY